MKHLILTLAIGFTMLSAKANHGSVLKLKMFDNGAFSVVLDEKPSHSQSSFFKKDYIKPGFHKLKVIRYYNAPYSYHPIQKVVYKGWINIPPASVVTASISCHNELDTRIEPKFCPRVGGGFGGGYGGGYGGGCDEPGYGSNYGNGWNNPAPPTHPMPVCISNANFMQLKSSIASKAFESSRFDIAKQALSYSHFTSAQVTDLTRIFSFESTRLEFAKLAFGKTIDKENYFMVNDAFSFESSIGELSECIAMYK